MRKKEPLLPVLILGLLAFTVLWPLWFTVDGALMASDELTAALGPALLDTADGGYAVWTILPSWPTLQPLAELLLDTPQFFSVFWNTCLLAFAQIAGQLVVAAPASWAFAKLRFAGRRFLLLGYIALMVLPFQVLMVPNYLIATRLGIYDTPLSVILPGVFSAFPVFIMTRSFQDVPNELLEAAKLDGATAWQIFWKIGVPLGYAGIFAALVLNFIEGWNAVEQPLLFLKSQSNWPLSMYMNDIVTDNLGIAMAASLLSLIPAMLVFLYGQTYLELGIQAGGIKAYAELRNARLNEAAEIRKLRTYYDDFRGWAEEFDTAPLEMKRMILSHLIDRVEVGRKYQVIVKFNMKYRQFLECTAETYNTEIGA